MNAMGYLWRVAVVYLAWLVMAWLALAMLWQWVLEPVLHWRPLYLSEMGALMVVAGLFCFRGPHPAQLADGWQMPRAMIHAMAGPLAALLAGWAASVFIGG